MVQKHLVNRIGKFNFDTHTHALPRNRINSFLTWKYKEYETGLMQGISAAMKIIVLFQIVRLALDTEVKLIHSWF